MPLSSNDEPILAFKTAPAFEAWLAKRHAKAPGLWLRLYKKGSGKASLSYAEALDAALCYGWIDAKKDKLDALSWVQRFCPRRPKGAWSKRNIEHVERLIKAGRLRPTGLAAVQAAKDDGRWARAYDPPSRHQVPADLLAALDKDKKAQAFFATLNRANTYAIAYRLQTAKKPETRARRFEALLAMLKRGEKLH
jgi:uncharacterized protein YdeI (YjbR/CyaY-like superfamily)